MLNCWAVAGAMIRSDGIGFATATATATATAAGIYGFVLVFRILDIVVDVGRVVILVGSLHRSIKKGRLNCWAVAGAMTISVRAGSKLK